MLRYDLTIVQGESFTQDVNFRTATNVYSLVGYTARSQIRPEAGSNELTAEFTCEVFPKDGYIRMTLTEEQTKAIPMGTYEYDLLIHKDGINNYYIGGKINVEKHVTEPL